MRSDLSFQTCPLPEPLGSSAEEWKSGPVGPSEEIEGLARERVSPSFFHQEERGRFDSLTACGSERIALFHNDLDSLSERIGSLPASEIASRLKQFYEAAYRYDPANGTMDVANRRAHRELDLWIAALDHKAYGDEAFLKKIRQPEVERILALNSPRLSDKDRGLEYQRENGLISERQLARKNVSDVLDWLKHYDGRGVWSETPFWRSRFESWQVAIARYGREKANQLALESFPDEETLRMMLSSARLEELYDDLSDLSDDELIARSWDLSGIMRQQPGPKMAQNAVREIAVVSLVLDGRGRNLDESVREFFIRKIMRSGLTRGDAELVVNQNAIRMTASRLDDYEARFRYLEKFGEIYTDFLTAPIDQKFSTERSARYNLWGQFLLNHGASGVPLSLADLDRVRNEVQAKFPQKTDGPVSYRNIVGRDPEMPLWFRPADLAMRSEPDQPGLPLVQLKIGGESLVEYAARNVDFIAVLPDELMPSSHALGIAYGLFGAVILHGEEARSEGERYLSPELLAGTLAHEAAHQDWARSNFDDHPERLSWMGPDERRAYLLGRDVRRQYAATGLPTSSALLKLEDQDDFETRVIQAANRRLGLDLNDVTPKFFDSRWERRDPAFFFFQPGTMVNPDGTAIPDVSAVVASLPDGLKSDYWESFLNQSSRGLDELDKADLRDVLDVLNALKDGEISETFPSDDVLIQVLNRMNTEIGMPLLEHATFTRESWKQFRDLRAGYIHFDRLRDRQYEQVWRTIENYRTEFLGREAHRMGLTAIEKEELLSQWDRLNDLGHPDYFTPGKTALIRGDSPLGRILNRRFLESRLPPRESFDVNWAQWRSMRVSLLSEAVAGSVCSQPK